MARNKMQAVAAAVVDDEREPGATPLGEDWHLPSEVEAKPEIDDKLAGLYEVTHGTLFFDEKKVVRGPEFEEDEQGNRTLKRRGRRVMLTAAQAFHFLQMDRPEDQRDPCVRRVTAPV